MGVSGGVCGLVLPWVDIGFGVSPSTDHELGEEDCMDGKVVLGFVVISGIDVEGLVVGFIVVVG